jgi:peptidyl-prolyl cis-trans isomerase D
MDGIDVGAVSPVFTMEDKYVVAVVTKATEKGIPSMEEIRDILEPLIVKDLKGDVMVQRMAEISNQTSDLLEIAAQLNSKVDTVENVTFNLRNIAGYGNESNVIAALFSMEPNVLSDPIKGNNSAFFVIVDEVVPPKKGEDFSIYERQLLMNFRAKVNNNSFTNTLEEEAGIVDNRVKFY